MIRNTRNRRIRPPMLAKFKSCDQEIKRCDQELWLLCVWSRRVVAFMCIVDDQKVAFMCIVDDQKVKLRLLYYLNLPSWLGNIAISTKRQNLKA